MNQETKMFTSLSFWTPFLYAAIFYIIWEIVGYICSLWEGTVYWVLAITIFLLLFTIGKVLYDREAKDANKTN